MVTKPPNTSCHLSPVTCHQLESWHSSSISASSPVLTYSSMTMASTPQRQSTYPLSFSSRHKPRRWPLVLRFVKGAIHGEIILPVIFHSAWAALIVYLNTLTDGDFALPNGIIPSLSIVVGLMLVCSIARAWSGFVSSLLYTKRFRCFETRPPMTDSGPDDSSSPQSSPPFET